MHSFAGKLAPAAFERSTTDEAVFTLCVFLSNTAFICALPVVAGKYPTNNSTRFLEVHTEPITRQQHPATVKVSAILTADCQHGTNSGYQQMR